MTAARRRPRRPGSVRVEVRFQPDELDQIRRAAEAPGLGVSVARYVAEASLATAGARPPTRRSRAPSRLALAEIADATSAVSRVGNNLNQLARQQNITHERPADADDEVRRAQVALERLTDAVIRARQQVIVLPDDL